MTLFLADALHFQAESHIVERAQVRKQRKALEHHRGAAVGGRQIGDVPVLQQDIAAGHRFMAGNHAQRGAFAATGRAQQTAITRAGNPQGNVVDSRLAVTEAFGQPNHFDAGCLQTGQGIHGAIYRKGCASFQLFFASARARLDAQCLSCLVRSRAPFGCAKRLVAPSWHK